MPDALCSSTGSLQALTGGPKVFKPFMPGVATQGYQMADVPAARYRAGLNALADYIKSTFAGKPFRDLPPTKMPAWQCGSVTWFLS
jgi:hypothetical protein